MTDKKPTDKPEPETEGKRKAVAYQLVKQDTIAGRAMYAMCNDLVEAHHEEITNARIALAWALSWKQDVDGHVKLGQCKKTSDLDRELHPFDFVILLNAEWWQDGRVTDDQRRALLDHELCHATVKLDEDGEPARDALDRVVYRLRKHDIEEFTEIVARHGTYKRDLERFASALRRGQRQGTLPPDVMAPPVGPITDALRRIAPQVGSEISSVTIEAGGQSVTLTQEDRARMDAEASRSRPPRATH